MLTNKNSEFKSNFEKILIFLKIFKKNISLYNFKINGFNEVNYFSITKALAKLIKKIKKNNNRLSFIFSILIK